MLMLTEVKKSNWLWMTLIN